MSSKDRPSCMSKMDWYLTFTVALSILRWMRHREVQETTWLVLGIFAIYLVPILVSALTGS